jgi:sterol desaturase/sphingolipid hydroxylase (fatty acid hydroxylase superfamily)
MQQVIDYLSSFEGLLTLGGWYFGLILCERLWYLVKGYRWNDADAWCSVGLNLMNSFLGIAVNFVLPLALYVVVWENFRLFDGWPIIPAMVVAFIIHDLAYYAEHRMAHRVGILWAFHAIHHSSNEFNHSTAARGFYFDGVMRTPFELPAALIGIPPPVYIAMAILKNAWGIWNHASYVGHLGWLDRVLATPMNHKVHHANQPQYIDTNYSQVLLWDRLFGTFAPAVEPPVVGLVKPVHENNPLTAQFAGFVQLRDRMREATRWQDKLAYVWRPPEWSHDGVCRSDCPKYGHAGFVG